MYISNENELAKRLKDNTLTEWEQTQQYMAMLLLFGPLAKRVEPIWLGIALTAATLILGTIYCYNINKNGDNKDFIKRIACLAVPVAFNLALLLLVSSLGFLLPIFLLLTYVLPDGLPNIQQIFTENTNLLLATQSLLAIAYSAVYYWRLGKQIHKISH